ncbi:hypothetical protein BD408DRAFT_434158 [Parasitella parasitica]|nr:hypothetical protein BD408DRAFT_434158 [Parasitella parasitica]
MNSQQNNKTETYATIAARARSRRSSDMNVDSDTQMPERQEGHPSSVSSNIAALHEAELDENIERELSDGAIPLDTS